MVAKVRPHRPADPVLSATRQRRVSILALFLALAAFLTLGAYQLDLPGLHYDEAREAGVNAMQLLTGQPVTAFRGATVQLGPWRLPLMVQDYIGALNVVLAIPFLGVGGIHVVALRWLPLVIGALTLLLAWRVAYSLGGPGAAAVAALLLAVNPSFAFWSRQGIFVTNLTALLFMASLLAAIRWWRRRERRYLWTTALLFGLGIYAKLLFVWVIGAMAGVALSAWAIARWGGRPAGSAAEGEPGKGEESPAGPGARQRAHGGAAAWLVAGLCFLIPLLPLIVFNLRTEGTLAAIFGNLHKSYYGIDNSAYLANLQARAVQVIALLRGDHFWYLGEAFANPWAPWLAAALVAGALAFGVGRSKVITLLGLFALAAAQSAFTVSDLFITHYALLLPLVPLSAGVACAAWMRGVAQGSRTRGRAPARGAPTLQTALRALLAMVPVLLVAWWGVGDLSTTVRYHRVLHISGGYASHSDAIYDLASYLEHSGQSAPLALDWGLDAPVRFLTAGKVSPVEVFGYESLAAPDDAFADRVRGALADPSALFLAHSPQAVVFGGRVEALQALAAQSGLHLREDARFAERNGRPLFEVYSVAP